MTIRDAFIAFALKYNITLNESNQDILSFYISGKKGKYNSFAMCMEDDKMFAYFVDCNIRVEPKNRSIISEYLMKLNYNLKIGSFQMDYNTGDITVRACQYIFGSDEEQKNTIEQIILILGMIADTYCYDIIKELE